jgi:glycerol-3-phosphate cytidylyltransferase
VIRVITYGTFDLFHLGHLNILRRAKACGDWLAVGVSTDEFNAIKGKSCIYPYSHRSDIVRAIRYVDFVFPEACWEQKQDDVTKYDIDILVMGSDWDGKFNNISCKVVYLPRTEGIATTTIITTIRNR